MYDDRAVACGSPIVAPTRSISDQVETILEMQENVRDVVKHVSNLLIYGEPVNGTACSAGKLESVEKRPSVQTRLAEATTHMEEILKEVSDIEGHIR